jgi:pilus assembly protein CpaB
VSTPDSLARRPSVLHPFLRDRLRQAVGNRGRPRTLTLRRITAAVLVLLAAALALRPTATDEAASRPMLVAARDLAPGSTLTPADVRIVRGPDELVPAAALDEVAQASGRVLAGAATSGEPITSARLVGAENTRLSTGAADAVAVPVRLADAAVAELLVPGARVDVVTLDPRGATDALLAADATVVTVRGDDADGAHPLEKGRLVVVALPREEATRVASVSLGQPVTVTLR